MVKSVKRCLHWHVISRLIYNPIIDTINLSAGPRGVALGELAWRSLHPSGLGPARGKLGLLSRRLSEGLGAARFSWSGAGCQRAHTSPLPPDSGLLVFMLTCVSDAHSPVWFLLKNNKNLIQENSICIPPLAPNIFQFLQEMTDVLGFYF